MPTLFVYSTCICVCVCIGQVHCLIGSIFQTNETKQQQQQTHRTIIKRNLFGLQSASVGAISALLLVALITFIYVRR